MKKVGGWGIYHAAEEYGFHKVYRRLIEGVRVLQIPETQAKILKYGIKETMRAPATASKWLNDSKMIDFLEQYAKHVLKVDKNIPPFFITIAKVIVGRTGMGKVFNTFYKPPRE